MVRSWVPRHLVVLVATLAIAASASTANAQDKLDRALRDGKNSGQSLRVIVKAKPGYEAWARQLLQQSGTHIDAELPSINALAVELSGGQLDLCKSSVVESCSEDTYVSPSQFAASFAARSRRQTATAESFDGAKISEPSINTLLGTLGLTPSASFGYGATVALIDSGIYPSSAFDGRIKAFYDFTGGTTIAKYPFDDYGHGTHVAGIIAGTGYDSNGKHKGIAPGAKLIGLKVMDRYGRGYMGDVIAAIDYAISVKGTYNIRVINLSVAAGVFESYWLDPLTLATKRAVDNGIVVVASAGNLGQNALGQEQTGAITSPGNAPWVLTVGASSEEASSKRSNDTVAKFSSVGPTWIDFQAKPDLVAPGVGIESLTDSHTTLYQTVPSMLLSGSI